MSRKNRLMFFDKKGYVKVKRKELFDADDILLDEVWDEAAKLVSSVGALSDVAALFWSYRFNSADLSLSEKIDRVLKVYNLVK